MTNTETHTFLCHELEPSAYLCAKGFRFLGIKPAATSTNPNHVVFCFDDHDGLCFRQVLEYRQNATIPAQPFALALKQLKDQIFHRSMR